MKKPDTSGRRLLSDLVRTLERQDFDHQVSKVADHFGITKRQVLTEILGRPEPQRDTRRGATPRNVRSRKS